MSEPELENELVDSIGKAMEETVRPPPTLRPVPPKPMGLSDQWTKLQAIDRELRSRIRQEKLMLSAEFDRLLLATNADYDQRIDDAVAKMENERRAAVQALVAQTAEKLREHELLARRMAMDN